jgi:predicted small lipoprotein YifL
MERIVANLLAKARRATVKGRDYLVAPMTLINPGVLAGSQGPLYYPPEEVARNVDQWNGVMLTVQHPARNGRHVSARDPNVLDRQAVGHVFRAKVGAGGKLQAEGWFDVEAVRKVDNRVLLALESGKPIELSTGLYTQNEPREGMHFGKRYTHVARNLVSDHLAVLPDQVGACSIADGCGVLVNQGGWVSVNQENGNEQTSPAKKCECEEGGELCPKCAEKLATAGKDWLPVKNELPSEEADVDPDKACQILKDGEVRGHELTEAQRGMFGAICGKRGKGTENRRRPTMFNMMTNADDDCKWVTIGGQPTCIKGGEIASGPLKGTKSGGKVSAEDKRKMDKVESKEKRARFKEAVKAGEERYKERQRESRKEGAKRKSEREYPKLSNKAEAASKRADLKGGVATHRKAKEAHQKAAEKLAESGKASGKEVEGHLEAIKHHENMMKQAKENQKFGREAAKTHREKQKTEEKRRSNEKAIARANRQIAKRKKTTNLGWQPIGQTENHQWQSFASAV